MAIVLSRLSGRFLFNVVKVITHNLRYPDSGPVSLIPKTNLALRTSSVLWAIQFLSQFQSPCHLNYFSPSTPLFHNSFTMGMPKAFRENQSYKGKLHVSWAPRLLICFIPTKLQAGFCSKPEEMRFSFPSF